MFSKNIIVLLCVVCSAVSEETSTDTPGEIGPLDDMREAFRVFDKNGDGLIDCDELKEVLETLFKQIRTVEEVESMIRAVAKDGVHVTFDEFVKMMSKKASHFDDAIFTEIDINGDGYVTPEEVHSHFKRTLIDVTLEGVKEAVFPYCKDKATLNMDFEEFKLFKQAHLQY